jgi:hypothetical protein
MATFEVNSAEWNKLKDYLNSDKGMFIPLSKHLMVGATE